MESPICQLPIMVHGDGASCLPPPPVACGRDDTDDAEAAAVACWHLAGGNMAKRANDIAFGIQDLIDSEYPVIEKETATQQ